MKSCSVIVARSRQPTDAFIMNCEIPHINRFGAQAGGCMVVAFLRAEK